jgi:hypothetical protein
MKSGQTVAKPKAEKAKLWQKTSHANLIRYLPGGIYFLRIRVRGELIRKSLKTDVLSVAKLRFKKKKTGRWRSGKWRFNAGAVR